MSIKYEGISFKNPPTVDVAAYPYIFLYISPTAEYKYRLTLSSSKYFYQSSDDTLQPGSNSVKNYWMTEAMAQSGADWELRDTTGYYWQTASARVVAANYNIPNESQTGTTFFLRKNMELPTLMNQSQNSTNGDTSCTVSMSGCEVGNLLVAAYAVRGSDNVVTLSDGWKTLGGGNNVSDPSSLYQRVFFASKIAESESETLTVSQTGTGRIYIVCAEFYGIEAAEIRNDLAAIGESNFTVTTGKVSAGDMMLYAVSSAYYSSGREQTASPNDMAKIQGDSSAERLAGWFDGGGDALSHTFRTCNVSETRDAIVEAVELFAKKIQYHTTGYADYLVSGTERIYSSVDSRVSWTVEVPDGTACEVLVKIGDGDFLTAENGGKIPGLSEGTDLTNTQVTVRVSLSTENTEVAPVLHSLSLWISDEDDKNVISLHFPEGNQNSVQNAISAFRISYNGITLEGIGGFVKPFDIEVSNDGLVYKGDQNDVEHISLSVQANGVLTKVNYSDTAENEHIEISVTAVGVLTHINDL